MLETATAKVYSELIPSHPGNGWTRFVCISDNHSRKFSVPPGDVLLHAGDLSSWGEFSHLKKTIDWLKSLDHPTKIIIAGNHDLCLDENWKGGLEGLPPESVDAAQTLVRSQELRDAGIYYLEHEAMRFNTDAGGEWNVYGSPAAPYYARGSFQYMSYKEAEEIYARIPSNTHILLTHTPPYEILDKTRRGKNAGCEVLASRLSQLNACRLHVFGHIHEAHGAEIEDERIGEGGVDNSVRRVSINAALPTGGRPIVVDIKNHIDD